MYYELFICSSINMWIHLIVHILSIKIVCLPHQYPICVGFKSNLWWIWNFWFIFKSSWSGLTTSSSCPILLIQTLFALWVCGWCNPIWTLLIVVIFVTIVLDQESCVNSKLLIMNVQLLSIVFTGTNNFACV